MVKASLAIIVALFVAFPVFAGNGCYGGSAFERVRFKEKHVVRSTASTVAGIPAGVVERLKFWNEHRVHLLDRRSDRGCTVTVNVGPPSEYKPMPPGPPPITVTVGSKSAPEAVVAFRDGRLLKRFLARQGVPQDQLDKAEAKLGGPILGQLLKILIEQGLPVLLEYLKSLLAGA